MRPLSLTDPDPALYSAADAQAIEVGQQAVKSEEDLSVRVLTVGQYAAEAQTLLDEHWVSPGYAWDDEDAEARFTLDLASMGSGWQAAAAAMAQQVGPYCAFCEIPIPTGLSLAHLLPETRFPNTAFNFDNLLPACASCAHAKGQQPNQHTARSDSAAAARTLLDPTQFAWPSRYWQSLGPTPVLPFRYDLVLARWDEDVLERVRLILPTEYPLLLEAWRGGQLSRERGLLAAQDGSGLVFAAHIAPSGADDGLRRGMQAMIELFQLNQVLPSGPKVPIDTRVASRTEAFLRALELRAALDNTVRNVPVPNPSPPPSGAGDPFANLIATTGFWGVWMTALADLPGTNGRLAKIFPLPSGVTWVI